MNLRWLTLALRLAGLILIGAAAVIFFSGGLSFRSEKQISSDTYEIHHTVVLSHSAVIPGLVGAVLVASSLFIRSKRAKISNQGDVFNANRSGSRRRDEL